MKLLLLLSALLSALAGAGGVVRAGPVPAQAVALVAAPSVARVARQVAPRPSASILTVPRAPLKVLAVAASVLPAEPRFGARRRE